MKNHPTFLFLALFSLIGCISQNDNNLQHRTTQVLVIGGGTSGVAAAIQAARDSVSVTLVEAGPWLGGMLTAAGVSATDGNHHLPSGLWGEFREKLYAYYGGADSVATGWVSHTQFEPHIGQRFWAEMADEEPQLTRIHGFWPVAVEKVGKRLAKVEFIDTAGSRLQITAEVFIDATELGDVLALAGAAYRTGQDREAMPHDPNIQDLTYCAVLQDFGPTANQRIPEPAEYDPQEFACICKEVCQDTSIKVVDCHTFLQYARFPNNKYLLNWPNTGNDYYLNPIPLSHKERITAYQAAKARTIRLVYFIQTEMGYPQLGLATDEFPTEDLLPLIPYHRESRRINGVINLKVSDLADPYTNPERPWYKQAIAVGDYPLDHHHGKNPLAHEETFPPIPSFSIPYGCLVPKEIDRLLVAEKSISVSHDANGATRLQPCVISIGQAAGAAAALCVQKKQPPRTLEVADLQAHLLKAGCWLMPFRDVAPGDTLFEAVQWAGIRGILRGKGIPYQWANQTWFYPERGVSRAEFRDALLVVKGEKEVNDYGPMEEGAELPLTPKEAREMLREAFPMWKVGVLGGFSREKITRGEVAQLLGDFIQSF